MTENAITSKRIDDIEIGNSSQPGNPPMPAMMTTNDRLLEAAIASGNTDVLKELLILKREEKEWESKRLFNAAMAAFQNDVPEYYKTKKNKQTDSLYASLEDIMVQVTPKLAKCQLHVSWDTKTENGLMHVRPVLRHAMGHVEKGDWISAEPDNKGIKGSVNKTGIHAMKSTFSYLKRISIESFLGLSAAGDDQDGNIMKEVIDADQAEEIKALIKKTKANGAALLKFAGAEKISDIPLAKYGQVMKGLKSKEKEMKPAKPAKPAPAKGDKTPADEPSKAEKERFSLEEIYNNTYKDVLQKAKFDADLAENDDLENMSDKKLKEVVENIKSLTEGAK